MIWTVPKKVEMMEVLKVLVMEPQILSEKAMEHLTEWVGNFR